jgi:hypothetical protein
MGILYSLPTKYSEQGYPWAVAAALLVVGQRKEMSLHRLTAGLERIYIGCTAFSRLLAEEQCAQITWIRLSLK